MLRAGCFTTAVGIKNIDFTADGVEHILMSSAECFTTGPPVPPGPLVEHYSSLALSASRRIDVAWGMRTSGPPIAEQEPQV